ncbi:phage tail assembly protein [Serratia liquefaciens]|uniref:phage tail assembly protein n=1 Tax=Serratia liquefaciens TaxID=614 RepID=UPI00301D7DE0
MSYPTNKQEITFYSPLTLEDGSALTRVFMREPLVRDRIEFSRMKGNDLENEVAMIANLCDMNVRDVENLTSADFSQLEDMFNDFLLPPEKREKSTSSEA